MRAARLGADGFGFFGGWGRGDRSEQFGDVEIVRAERVVCGVYPRNDGGGEEQSNENERCDEDTAAGFEVGAVQIGFNKLVEHKQFLLKFHGANRFGSFADEPLDSER